MEHLRLDYEGNKESPSSIYPARPGEEIGFLRMRQCSPMETGPVMTAWARISVPSPTRMGPFSASRTAPAHSLVP